ncbi:MAG: hypothetical protein D6754_03260 [Alphaproteobacteria bacterium]|nr:MAG: hypothetical protein D6754_03260 [Alphaproteobacteria bacterium]
MGARDIIWLAALVLCFAIWMVNMFRTLYRLKARAEERLRDGGGGPVAGIGNTASTFGEFFTRPEWRRDRRRLLVMTATLFAVIAIGPLFLAQAG